MKKIVFLAIIATIFFGCKKTELVRIDDNNPPPDYTIDSVTIINYVNRTYILTLGREPDSIEFLSAKNILLSNGTDSASRRTFLEMIFNSPDYLPQVYENNKIDLINNTDTAEFSNWIFIYTTFLQDSTYIFEWPALQFELVRMTAMRDAFPLFVSSAISVADLQRRMCNNYIYDQINMGSANFVISAYQHLLNRNPTNSEQQNGISMIEGNNGVILLQAGSSKSDFLNILTTSNNYYEAQVVFLYKKYLNRVPNTTEMYEGTLKYSSTQDYTAVQKDILSTNEFIGIQ